MAAKAVSFDAAGTLVRVRWDPSQIALKAIAEAGISLDDPAAAQATYKAMLAQRWPVFVRLNLQRSQDICDQFWLDISRDWLESIGCGPDRAAEVFEIAQQEVFGPGTGVFTLFQDTIPALSALSEAGIPLIVLSNWDVSLHRTLRLLGITHYFKTVVASLEEGVEKPDPKLFDIAVSRLGLHPGEVLHVGDDPIADIQGAQEAGLAALLLDRSLDEDTAGAVCSLTSVIGRL